MFNIGMMELVLVLLVAFLVVGPKDLPRVARWIARQVKNVRKLIREVKKETGWSELAAEFKDTSDELKGVMKDADVRSELKSAADELNEEMKAVQKEVDAASDTVKAAGDAIRTDIEGGNEQ